MNADMDGASSQLFSRYFRPGMLCFQHGTKCQVHKVRSPRFQKEDRLKRTPLLSGV